MGREEQAQGVQQPQVLLRGGPAPGAFAVEPPQQGLDGPVLGTQFAREPFRAVHGGLRPAGM
ncbi:hypothetical protein ACFQ0M_02325 [Kitasatospora aburaviensis]